MKNIKGIIITNDVIKSLKSRASFSGLDSETMSIDELVDHSKENPCVNHKWDKPYATIDGVTKERKCLLCGGLQSN